MRPHRAPNLADEGAHGQQEGAQYIQTASTTHKPRMLLMGQVTANVRVRGRLCACMRAHAASAQFVSKAPGSVQRRRCFTAWADA